MNSLRSRSKRNLCARSCSSADNSPLNASTEAVSRSKGWRHTEKVDQYPADELHMWLAQHFVVGGIDFVGPHAAFTACAPSLQGSVNVVIGLFGSLE